MKQLTLLFIIALFIGCKSDLTKFEDALCITNISTIDPNTGLHPNQTVIISGGKIKKIAPSAELKLHPDNKTIDGTGKFLIPGLWDAHVHFVFMEELGPSMFDMFLSYGITSVRDTGGC